MPSHSPSRDRVIAALEAQACKSARAEIKARAHYYALAPSYLDAIIAGLATLTPRRAVECLEAYRQPPHWRYFGFGGERMAINVRGALLYARYARAKAHQLARRAA